LKRFVLDASITLAWFVDPVIAPLAMRIQQLLLQGDRAIVPYLWRSEVANGFVMAQRRGILNVVRTAQALTELDLLVGQFIDSANHDLPIQRIVSTAQHFALTAYDATYLDTAREQNLPLATLDRKLAEAAGQAGVSLIV
jgi:predicted nucleic acid-binding protein